MQLNCIGCSFVNCWACTGTRLWTTCKWWQWRLLPVVLSGSHSYPCGGAWRIFSCFCVGWRVDEGIAIRCGPYEGISGVGVLGVSVAGGAV